VVKTPRKVCSFEQKYQIAEILRNKIELTRACCTTAEVRALLPEITFTYSDSTLREVLRTINVKLSKRRQPGGSPPRVNTRIRGYDKAVLVDAVLQLYQQLGVAPPVPLTALRRELTEWDNKLAAVAAAQADAAPQPLPVPSETLRVIVPQQHQDPHRARAQ
jgi:hypothetical protein